MGIDQNLRQLQDRLRNAGWRIQHIPWQPEGKQAYHKPNDPLSWMIVSTGLAGYLDRRIDADRRCTLWVNPRNPLQTVFHKKPSMACHD